MSRDEILAAVIVAANRKLTSDARRAAGEESRRPEHYDETRTWDQEIESTIAEEAVCRWRNRYWMGAHFNGTSGSDAGRGQVRWTEHLKGHLVIYDEDDPEATFVLVVGRSPDLFIVGWLRCKDARQERYRREKPEVKCPSWWVPQSDLRSIT